MKQFIECDSQMPPSGLLVYAIRQVDESEAYLCRWDNIGKTWGIHVSMIRWRYLTWFEKINVELGILKDGMKIKV
jgi:hypothetical protein